MFDLTPKGRANPNQVQLLVNGMIYEGWTSFNIVRSIEAPSGSFNLTVSDKWPGQTKPWPIEPGDECQVNLGGESLVTGYVDETTYSLTAESRDLTVVGRDKTGDLVDCSYVDKPDQWRGADSAAIAQALAAPFGISVNYEGTPEAFKNFKVEPGETAHEAIIRLGKLKGCLAWPDGRGNLNIGPAGSRSLGLTIRETEFISCRVTHSLVDRFSDYQVKGQRPTVSDGKNELKAKEDTQTREDAQDPAVKRYRPLMLLSEGPGAEAKERALWEAAARAGRGLEVEVVVPGFTHSGGGLWPINMLVGVSSPGICLADELLISQVQFDYGPQSGHTTTLTLCRPDAFKPEPVKEPKSAGGGKGDKKGQKGGAGGGFPPGTIVFD